MVKREATCNGNRRGGTSKYPTHTLLGPGVDIVAKSLELIVGSW